MIRKITEAKDTRSEVKKFVIGFIDESEEDLMDNILDSGIGNEDDDLVEITSDIVEKVKKYIKTL